MLWQSPLRARVAAAALVAGLAGALSGDTPAASPLFATATATGTTAASASLTISTPPGAGADHVLVASVAFRAESVIAAPAGWSEAVRTTCLGNRGENVTQAVFVRAAAPVEPETVTFTSTTAAGATGVIAAYAGVDREQPVLASGGQIRRNSRYVTAPSLSIPLPGALLVAVHTHTGTAAIEAAPGMTARAVASATPNLRTLLSDELRPSAGVTGVRTSPTNQDNNCAIGQHVALRPAPDPPVSTEPPQVAGFAQEGGTLTATTGAWSSPPTAYAFRWQREDGDGWNDVPGATAAGYTATSADAGSRLRVVVTASNSGGSGEAASDPTAPVLPAPPASTSPPTISGEPRELAPLSADPGTWSGAPVNVAYAWERSADGQAWEPIADATGSGYVPGPADVGKLLRVAVTAANAGGASTARSAATAPVEPAAPPTSQVPPTISGWRQDGEPLLATAGAWAGVPTAYAYRWQRAADGETWEETGAEAEMYLLTAADVGAWIRVVVTASNAAGSSSATSDPTGPIGPAVAPTNVEPPVLTSGPVQGVALQATTGLWANAPHAYAFQWRRSADDGAGWTDIAGADGSSYTPTDTDVGLRLSVVVTAANPSGATSAASPASEPVLPPPPLLVTAPSLSGPALEGETLVVSTGDWENEPTAFDYEWQRCDAAACTTIRWEVDERYVVRDDDVGYAVRAVVTAWNAAGSATAASPLSESVLPLPPANEEPPELAGVAAQGETLTSTSGEWESAAPVAYTFRWQRSADDGATWTDVPEADGPSYVLGTADIGLTFRAIVTATNAGGSSEAASAGTAAVTPPGTPAAVAAPTISGVVQERGRLLAMTGTWSGSPSFTYLWQRSVDGGATWTNPARGTSVRYTAVAADVGHLLRVVVTATNEYGSTVAATEGQRIFPAGNRRYLLNATWYCDSAVDLELVRVTIVSGRAVDAIRFDECTGRIGRVEIDTNGIDGLKVRNAGQVATDLVIEGGYVRCNGHPDLAHQDGIQVLGGTRVTFRNLVIWCGGPDPDFGAGVNSSAMINRAGSGATTPTDVVIEHSVMGPGTANGVLVESSIRSGLRGSVACPDWTVAGGPVLLTEEAVDGIDVDNEKPGPEDPRCSSFEAALAWAAAP